MAHKIVHSIYNTVTTYSQAIAQRVPLDILLRTLGYGPLVLYYHTVSDERLPHVANLYRYKNTKEFENDLDYLLSEFKPITIQDLKEYLLNGRKLHPNSFFLTFDDGLSEIFTVVAPILKKKGIPAAFFVSSGFSDNTKLFYRFKASVLIEKFNTHGMSESASSQIKRILETEGVPWQGDFASMILKVDYNQSVLLDQVAQILDCDFAAYLKARKPYMDATQLRSLSENGFSIGSHSIDHPTYSRLDLNEQLLQTRGGAQALKEMTGIDTKLFAFPFTENGVNEEFYRILLNEGLVDVFFGTSSNEHTPNINLLTRISLEGDKPRASISMRNDLIGKAIRRLTRKQ